MRGWHDIVRPLSPILGNIFHALCNSTLIQDHVPLSEVVMWLTQLLLER